MSLGTTKLLKLSQKILHLKNKDYPAQITGEQLRDICAGFLFYHDLAKSYLKMLQKNKEKYRWRKQSEEPAPDDERVLEATWFPNGEWICISFIGRGVSGCSYWQPLDFPESEDDHE